VPYRRGKTKRDKWPWVFGTHPIDPLWPCPEMWHTTTPTWWAPLKRAYNTHFKYPRDPPADSLLEHLKFLMSPEKLPDQVTVG
jgi:hypothetical protein